MHKKKRVPRALTEGGPGAPGAADRARVKEALGAGTLPLFDFGGLFVRAENGDGGTLLYHLYGRQFPLDDRRVAVIEDLPKEGAFGELGRLWVFGQTGWREWRPSALGSDEHDLAGPRVATPCGSRSCTASTTGVRWPTPAHPTSAGMDAICRARSRMTFPSHATSPGTLLDTIDRLSAARDPTATPTGAGPGPVAATTASDTPPAPPSLPAVGLPPQTAGSAPPSPSPSPR